MIVKTVNGVSIKPPFYVLNEDRLKEVYLRLHRAFSSLYDKFIIAYSYKANYVPHMCKVLHKLGAYAEVVSRLEYDLAYRLISNTSHIIFNGPVKSYSDVALALNHNSIVNLDSFYEIEHLKKYCSKNPSKNIKVGIRVNFSLSQAHRLGVQKSRFGFSFENADLQRALLRIQEIPNVKVTCLHCHLSSRTRSQYVFKEITARLCRIALQYLDGTVDYIDIGGNFGHAPKEMASLQFPSFEEYALTITSELKKYINAHFKPSLIIEPGISLVGRAYDFVCNVIDVKRINKKKFIVVDGSVHNVKPTMHKHNLPVKVIGREGKIKTGSNVLYHVVGNTCMEKDYLLKNFKGPEVGAGDYIIFSNVGAYTIVLNPPFIHPHPPILVKKNSDYHIIRRTETFRDFFTTFEL